MPKVKSPIAAPVAALGAFMLVSALAADAATARMEQSLAASMNKLGSETIGGLASPGGSRTVIVSPYGLGSALHLLSLGAEGPAKKSLLARLLPQEVKEAQQAEALSTLKQSVLGASRDKLKLTMASAVFVPKSGKPSTLFVAAARGVFDAPAETLDFKSPEALQRINSWAKEATHGLIPRVVEQLDPQARFVLANAIYFNGSWETAFDAVRTAKAPFTRVDGSKRDAAMMDATMPVDFAEFDKLHAVWLPYQGKDVAMLIIAPAAGQGPTTVPEALKGKSLAGLMAAAEQKRRVAAVQVRLPRFRVEGNQDVTGVLSGLGLAKALGAGSNYSAINNTRGGELQVVHRAVLEVTESGTKAAAATVITSNRSLEVTPELSADRPFAFAIVHRPTQAVLFAGYIADPGDDPGPARDKSVSEK